MSQNYLVISASDSDIVLEKSLEVDKNKIKKSQNNCHISWNFLPDRVQLDDIYMGS